jgi:ADP-heptose:LPS heptosyltransferase
VVLEHQEWGEAVIETYRMTKVERLEARKCAQLLARHAKELNRLAGVINQQVNWRGKLYLGNVSAAASKMGAARLPLRRFRRLIERFRDRQERELVLGK